MWKDWINGILGIFIVILAFLGFPSSIKAVLMIAIGLIIAFLSFWKGASARVKKEISASFEEREPKNENEENIQ